MGRNCVGYGEGCGTKALSFGSYLRRGSKWDSGYWKEKGWGRGLNRGFAR